MLVSPSKQGMRWPCLLLLGMCAVAGAQRRQIPRYKMPVKGKFVTLHDDMYNVIQRVLKYCNMNQKGNKRSMTRICSLTRTLVKKASRKKESSLFEMNKVLGWPKGSNMNLQKLMSLLQRKSPDFIENLTDLVKTDEIGNILELAKTGSFKELLNLSQNEDIKDLLNFTQLVSFQKLKPLIEDGKFRDLLKLFLTGNLQNVMNLTQGDNLQKILNLVEAGKLQDLIAVVQNGNLQELIDNGQTIDSDDLLSALAENDNLGGDQPIPLPEDLAEIIAMKDPSPEPFEDRNKLDSSFDMDDLNRLIKLVFDSHVNGNNKELIETLKEIIPQEQMFLLISLFSGAGETPLNFEDLSVIQKSMLQNSLDQLPDMIKSTLKDLLIKYGSKEMTSDGNDFTRDAEPVMEPSNDIPSWWPSEDVEPEIESADIFSPWLLPEEDVDMILDPMVMPDQPNMDAQILEASDIDAPSMALPPQSMSRGFPLKPMAKGIPNNEDPPMHIPGNSRGFPNMDVQSSSRASPGLDAPKDVTDLSKSNNEKPDRSNKPRKKKSDWNTKPVTGRPERPTTQTNSSKRPILQPRPLPVFNQTNGSKVDQHQNSLGPNKPVSDKPRRPTKPVTRRPRPNKRPYRPNKPVTNKPETNKPNSTNQAKPNVPMPRPMPRPWFGHQTQDGNKTSQGENLPEKLAEQLPEQLAEQFIASMNLSEPTEGFRPNKKIWEQRNNSSGEERLGWNYANRWPSIRQNATHTSNLEEKIPHIYIDFNKTNETREYYLRRKSEHLRKKADENLQEKLAKQWHEKMDEEWSEKLSEVWPEKLGEQWPEKLGEQYLEKLGEQWPEKLGEQYLEKLGEQWPELAENLPDKVTEELPEKLAEQFMDRMNFNLDESNGSDLSSTDE